MGVNITKFVEHGGGWDGGVFYLESITTNERGNIISKEWLVHPTGKLPKGIREIEECRRFNSMWSCFDYCNELKHKGVQDEK